MGSARIGGSGGGFGRVVPGRVSRRVGVDPPVVAKTRFVTGSAGTLDGRVLLASIIGAVQEVDVRILDDGRGGLSLPDLIFPIGALIGALIAGIG